MATERTGQTTNFSNQKLSKTNLDLYQVEARDTDTIAGGGRYIPNWKKWHGYYRAIPEYRAVINKMASWTFGRGIKASKKEMNKLKRFVGIGKDVPRSILKNQWKTALICGDSFGEITKDTAGRKTNLKPLNPGTTAIVYDEYGIITSYEQWDQDKKINSWEPDEIFHLSYERIADEVHGIPFAEAIEELMLARNEALEDLRILYHRNIKPINWIEVETDDTTKLNNIEKSVNKAYRKTENIIIPKGVVSEIKSQKTGQFATLDSIPYIKLLIRQFVTACGIPEVIMGWGGDTTEASSKVIYLAFQQEIEDIQKYIEEQIKTQLGIKIELEFPASLEEEMKKDEKKDAGYQGKVKVGKTGSDTK